MQSTKTIVVVDDDAKILSLISKLLKQHSFNVISLSSGKNLLNVLSNKNIALIILDVMMPESNGLDLCRKIRKENIIIPIIFLSALSEDSDRMIGLELGADDYLPKPFHPRELLARINALLRRVEFHSSRSKILTTNNTSKYMFYGWIVNTKLRMLKSPDELEIHLTAGEYELLLVFLNTPNRVLSRDYLIERVYGSNAGVFDRSIDIHISRLRQKIEKDSKYPKIIKTIRNGGYILTSEVIRK